MTIPLWIDCDPGHDDAIALLLGSSLSLFDLLGVSTVHGNSSLEHTTNNAISLLVAYSAHGISVFPGAEKPLHGAMRQAADIHGESGLDGTALLPNPTFDAEPDHSAVDEMARQIKAHPGQIAVCATGPLTNIAQLIQAYPEVVADIRFLSIMGGALGFGNTTKYAEFNIYADPEAAQIVFSNKALAAKTLLCPLNLTHKAIATQEVLEHIRTGGSSTNGVVTPVRQMLFELITFFANTYKKVQHFNDGPPVHDALAVIALAPFYGHLQPLSVSYDQMDITVVLEGERRGETVGTPAAQNAVRVIKNMDFKVFWDEVYCAIEYVDRNSH